MLYCGKQPTINGQASVPYVGADQLARGKENDSQAHQRETTIENPKKTQINQCDHSE